MRHFYHLILPALKKVCQNLMFYTVLDCELYCILSCLFPSVVLTDFFYKIGVSLQHMATFFQFLILTGVDVVDPA